MIKSYIFFNVFIIIIVFLSSTTCIYARDFYIDPIEGNNYNLGDKAAPFKTLKKVNKMVVAGDIVHLMPGDYIGVISPENSGSSASPIVYRSEKRRKAIFRTTARRLAVNLRYKNHITIDGIKVIASSKNGRWVKIVGTSSVSIIDSEMSGGEGKSPFVVKHSELFKIYGNDFSNYTNNMIVLSDMDKVIIDGNRFTNGGHAMLMLHPANTNKNIVIRNNIFHSKRGRGFAIFTAENVLFENNILMGSYNGGYSALPASKFLATNGIFRRNSLVNNFGVPLVITAYNKHLSVDHIRIYENLFKDNYRSAVLINGLESRTNDIVFQNNNFLGKTARDSSSYVRMKIWEKYNIKFINNNFFTVESSPYYPIWLDGIKKIKKALTIDELETAYPKYFKGNKSIHFDNKTFHDIQLKHIDPYKAIATIKGEGISLSVDDTYVFYDGYGIPGEVADSITIGGKAVDIKKIDHSNGTLELVDGAVWNDKDKIYITKNTVPLVKLNCNGKWFIFSDVGENCEIDVGGTVEFKSDYNDVGFQLDIDEESYQVNGYVKKIFDTVGLKSIRLVSTKGNGELIYAVAYINVVKNNSGSDELVHTQFDDDDWGWLWKLYRPKPAAYKIEYDDVLDRKVLKVYAKSNNSKMPARLFPKGWAIDSHPYINMRYRIKKGTVLSICLTGFNDYRHYIERCLASNEKNITSNEYVLLDDEEWHELVIDVRLMKKIYPGTVHLRGVIIGSRYPEQVKKGMSYWLDEFSISKTKSYKTD